MRGSRLGIGGLLRLLCLLGFLQQGSCALDLIADATRRGPALGDLRLEPGSTGEHLVILAVEAVGKGAQLVQLQLRETLSVVERVPHDTGDRAMRFAEWNAASHQEVGYLGCREELVTGGAR